ncbi:hypothetical protein Cch01nite_40390 [Cellulomonas chitinilytica]|uniref:Type IV secretion system protein n=1 Tax=Cellulomonas chitinilytica TaxID=398759 RepID=A0A919U0V4_9CELL|nr:hypothetical protein [Cellulomonas chitinilytica]GIG23315.1 hypothetical protein Cch01nite_40390 [Cellulomonas chitinilytica]
MDWGELLNPFTYLGNAASHAIADGWTVAMVGLWNAGLWVFRFLLTIVDWLLMPDLRTAGPIGEIYHVAFWIAGALVVLLFMVGLGSAIVRRDGQALGRTLIGAAQYGAVCALWGVYSVGVLAAAGGITTALMRSLLHVDAFAAWQPWANFSVADISDGTVATVLGLMGLVLMFGAIGHGLVMLARAVSLIVLAATAPVAAAGLVWDGGRGWFWKAFRWFHAAAFTPVLLVLVLGIAVKPTSNVAIGGSDSLQSALGTAIPGILLILVGAFLPLALFKLLAFVDPGTSSGAAMRAGLSAQGGVGGLLGGRGDSGTSDAASTPDGTGRSSGEASGEASTNDRFSQAAGGFGGALGGYGQAAFGAWGMAQGVAGRAAAVGADLTNQMGVGHNTYVPDFSGSRSGRGRARGDDDVPDVNGAGPGGEPEVPMPMPASPASLAAKATPASAAGEAVGGSSAAETAAAAAV